MNAVGKGVQYNGYAIVCGVLGAVFKPNIHIECGKGLGFLSLRRIG